MKNLSQSTRNIIIISAYLFLTVIFFITGYSIGLKNGEKLSEPFVAASVPNTLATNIPLETVSPSQYRVILEDGELRLYMDENGTGRLISNEKVSEESFPPHDIATLKEGKTFPTLEEALALMENFLS